MEPGPSSPHIFFCTCYLEPARAVTTPQGVVVIRTSDQSQCNLCSGGGRTMKFVFVALLAMSAVSSAQGVLERLEGNFNVLTTATNDAGTIFVEIDATPSNLEEALRQGIHRELNPAFAIITPATVAYVIEIGGEAYVETMPWVPFVFSNMPDFSTDTIRIKDTNGRLLTMDSIDEARNIGRSSQAALRPPPRNGCVSSTTGSGSSMTCYRNGLVTYRSICTAQTHGFGFSCRSDSF